MAQRTFAAIFPAGTAGVDSDGTPSWRIRGSGVTGEPTDARWTKAAAEFLTREGVAIECKLIMGMCCADMYQLEATFLDGGMHAETGNYFGYGRGASVTGVKAAVFIALGLGLRVPKALFDLHSLDPKLTLDDLRRELLASRAKTDTAA